ncbi:hypothetical protein [Brevundimonas sp.]|uniref:antitoxin n=1 Tax=Brevundimonas sp. TaxID=1871086 RepID=UPI001A1F02E8|nr:hypothetical protein [Brevundimonas sp.]MBJ7483787.1 hypothetical protein [Brevundimonas sp.]
MDGSQPVKLFRHGDGHAVDIPAGFTLPGDNAVMRQDGERLIIEPAELGAAKPSLSELLAQWAAEGPLDDDECMPEILDSPPRPFDL